MKKFSSLVVIFWVVAVATSVLAQSSPTFSKKDPEGNRKSFQAAGKTAVAKAESIAKLQATGKQAVVANSVFDAKYDSRDISSMTSYTPKLVYVDGDNKTVNAILVNSNGDANGIGFIHQSQNFIAGLAYIASSSVAEFGFDGTVSLLPLTSPVDVDAAGIRTYSLRYSISGGNYFGGKLYLISPFFDDGTISVYTESNKQLSTGVVGANLPIYGSSSRVQFDLDGNAYVLDPFQGNLSKTDSRTKTSQFLFDVDAPIAFRLLPNGSVLVLTGSYYDYDSDQNILGKVLRVDYINGVWVKKILSDNVTLNYNPFGDIISYPDGKEIYYTSGDGEISRILFDRLGNFSNTRFVSKQQSATSNICFLAFATMNGAAPASLSTFAEVSPGSRQTNRSLNR